MSENPPTIDAERLGALCGKCYLRHCREGGPIHNEVSRRAKAVLIGEAPGDEEVRQSRPFVGPSGRELTQSLQSVGASRDDFTFTNAIACRPPKNDLDRVMHRVQQENKKRVAAGLEPWLTPIEACRPRLYADLRSYANVITTGKTALRSLTGMMNSIMDLRGAPVTGVLMPSQVPGNGDLWIPKETLDPAPADAPVLAVPGARFMRVLPTIHPAFVMRMRRWTKVFRTDLGRAVRWFDGNFGWREPAALYKPTLSQARDFLYSGAPFYALDVETDAKESLVARLRCVGVSTCDAGIVIPFLSVDGQTRFYDPDEEAAMVDLLRTWCSDRAVLKVGWNCLAGVTRVVLEDGSSLPIERIVRERLDVRVRALDAKGNVVAAKILDYHRQRVEGQRWRVIEVEGQKGHARGLTVTPDHRIRTARGWVEAADVVAGDTMYVDEPRLTAEQRRAVLGTALGDSRVEVSNTRRGSSLWSASPTAALRGGHVPESHLTQRKTAALPFLTTREEVLTGFGGKETAMLQFAAPAMRQLGALVPLLYSGNGTRRLKPEALDALGAVGFAWWFMDDGNLMSRASESRPDVVQLALHRYSAGDRTVARAWFARRFGGRAWLTKRGDLILNREATEAFAAAVAPHVFPEARYKLPAEYRDVAFTPVVPPRGAKPLGVLVTRVYDYAPPRDTPGRAMAADTSYCLTTTTGNFFTNHGLVKNCGMYDRTVLEMQLHAKLHPFVDGILVHRNVDSELPHNLAFAGALFTDVARAWKASHAATTAQTDQELWTYNLGDCVVNARIMEPLFQAVHMRGQAQVVPKDHQAQAIAFGMHKNGIYVDQQVRRQLDEQYRKEAVEHLNTLRMTVGDPEFNPNSPVRVRRLLFDDWSLTPIEVTKLGDPSTNDDTIRKLLLNRALRPQQQDALRALRRYRRAAKYRGTFIRTMRPFDEPVYEDDPFAIDTNTAEGAALVDEVAQEIADAEEYLSPQQIRRVMKKAAGLVLADGRVHSNWNTHVATCVTPDTWVITDSGPAQIGNLPGWGPDRSEVLASGFELHDGDALRSVAWQVNPGPSPTLRATTVLGLTVAGPAHHRVQIAEQPRFARLGPRDATGHRVWESVEPAWKWQRLDELQPGEYVRVPIGMNTWAREAPALPRVERQPVRTCANDVTLPAALTEDLAWFMGVYNADGSLHDMNGSFGIRITDTRARRSEQVAACARRLFGADAVRENSNGTHITSVSLRAWCAALGFGRRIENKRAPRWILAAPRGYVLAYLRGLAFDSSLGVSGGVTPYWRYTGSKALCREVQMLLLNLGIPAAIYDKSSEERPHTWCVYVVAQDVATICAITSQEVPVPPRTGDDTQRRSQYIRRGNTLWLRVTSVRDDGVQPVLDVTVPTTHCFWSNGLVSHNTGRFSSSGPNVQNLPRVLRKMFRAEAGRAFIGCDEDQLELRISAAFANDAKYLEAFARGLDPHAITSEDIFGAAFRHGSEKDKKRIRDFAKRFVYAVVYGAMDDTIYEVISSAENDKGELIFPWVTLRETSTFVERWKREHPAYVTWWDTSIDTYRRDGFLEEPVFGRRRFFLDGEDRNEIINFPVQAAGASSVRKAEIALVEGPLPFEKWGPGTGMVQDGHDAVLAEVPCCHVEKGGYKWPKGAKIEYPNVDGHPPLGPGERCPAVDAAWAIREAMSMKFAHYDVMLTATPKIGKYWHEV